MSQVLQQHQQSLGRRRGEAFLPQLLLEEAAELERISGLARGEEGLRVNDVLLVQNWSGSLHWFWKKKWHINIVETFAVVSGSGSNGGASRPLPDGFH